MAKAPFKNLRSPAQNTNAPEPSPLLPKDPVACDRSVNGEQVNEGLRDGDKPLAWPKPESKMPMRLTNGGK